MKNQNALHALQLERLRRNIREGLDSGPARPWSVDEIKRQGRKRLAVRKAAEAEAVRQRGPQRLNRLRKNSISPQKEDTGAQESA
jgi:hypothetical protein